MKTISKSIFLIFITLCCLGAAEAQDAIRKPDAIGGFRQCSVYCVSFEDSREIKQLEKTITFNDEGYKTGKITYNLGDGKPVRRIQYNYNYPGDYKGFIGSTNVSVINSFTDNSDTMKLDKEGNKIIVTSRMYDEDSRDTLEPRYISTKKYIKWYGKYYEDKDSTVDRNLTNKTEQVMDNNCQALLKTLYFDSNNKLLDSVTYKWNKKKQMTERAIYRMSGYFERSVFKYDKKEILAGETVYNRDNAVLKEIKYKNDRKGNRLEENVIVNGKVNSRTVYKYDEYGNLVREEFYNPADRMVGERVYEFER